VGKAANATDIALCVFVCVRVRVCVCSCVCARVHGCVARCVYSHSLLGRVLHDPLLTRGNMVATPPLTIGYPHVIFYPQRTEFPQTISYIHIYTLHTHTHTHTHIAALPSHLSLSPSYACACSSPATLGGSTEQNFPLGPYVYLPEHPHQHEHRNALPTLNPKP
jgi:hypothetical protein